MQPQVQIAATNDTDSTITVLANQTRIEFIVRPDLYFSTLQRLHYNIGQEWFNKALVNILMASKEVEIEGKRHKRTPQNPNWGKDLIPMADTSKTPSNEYPYSAIAPTAKSLTWSGDRLWFKTISDCKDWCAGIYEQEPKRNFQLAIVQWVEIIEPKPTVELKSTVREIASSS